MNSLAESELLQFAIQNGIIDIDTIQRQIEMNERQRFLEMHPYKVWEDKQGNWHTYLPDDAKGRVRKKKRTEREVQNLIIDYWRGQAENPTINEVFTEWNDRRLRLGKIVPATHTRVRQYYERHYKEFGKQKIKNIESEEFIDFLEEQISVHNLTYKAFTNIRSITKGFLKRAKKRKLIDWNIEEALCDLDISDAEFKKIAKEDWEEVFDEEETSIMISYLLENLDTKNMAIMLMFITGLRIGEVSALKPDALDKDSVKVKRTETRWINSDGHYVYEVVEHAKTEAGWRQVIIPDAYNQFYTKVRLLNPFGEYVFCDSKGKRLSTVAIRRRLERVCKNAQVYRKSPHKIRKTYGTMLMDNNIDKRFIINQMGHTDITCSENHYHRDRKSIERKKALLNQIPEFKCV